MSDVQQQLYISKYADQKTLISFSKSMTSIEDLSNEFFYEIFEYFYDCDIYKAFSNLNNNFNTYLPAHRNCLRLILRGTFSAVKSLLSSISVHKVDLGEARKT